MNERPILFTPGNYQAILDGSKTQTRRIVKLPEERGAWEPFLFEGSKLLDSKGHAGEDLLCISNTTTGKIIASPHGQVGDRLYVKEGLERHGSICRYRRDRKVIVPARCFTWQRNTLSPLHMPKWAARLWLEITEVRVERLQDISEEDAIAEGVREGSGQFAGVFICPPAMSGTTARDCYMRLWESINGPGSWDANPFVWAITFKKTPPLDVRQAEA